MLSGVVIPDHLVEEEEDPEHLLDDEGDQLSDEEESEDKELSTDVEDQGLRILSNLMQGELFDGFDIQAVPVLCNSDEVHIDGKVLENNFYKDLEIVKRFYNSKTNKRTFENKPELNEIVKESKMIHRHMDRRQHSIIFRKCVEKLGDKPCKHCRENPPKASDDFWADMPRMDRGGLF